MALRLMPDDRTEEVDYWSTGRTSPKPRLMRRKFGWQVIYREVLPPTYLVQTNTSHIYYLEYIPADQRFNDGNDDNDDKMMSLKPNFALFMNQVFGH